MTDLRTTTEPKSDQLNADSLIGGKTMTIKITKVDLLAGDQPVAIHYENENGRPYKPCKSMRRVMVQVWGPDGSAYAGRSMTLYCDEKVQFGGMAVGGIRISHMSNIDAPISMALTATRASKKVYTVKPLKVQQTGSGAPSSQEPAGWRAELWAKAQAAGITQEGITAAFGSLKALAYERRGEVETWIQQQTGGTDEVCPECQQAQGHAESCPFWEPPEEEDQQQSFI